MSPWPRLLICAFHCVQCVTTAILSVCCMQNPLAFLFLSPSTVAQFSPTYSKDSAVIMRCSTIREIPTFLDYRITMRANPNWIYILNEAAPCFQMLVVTANVHVIIRQRHEPRLEKNQGLLFCPYRKGELNLVSNRHQRNANSLISYTRTNTSTGGSLKRLFLIRNFTWSIV